MTKSATETDAANAQMATSSDELAVFRQPPFANQVVELTNLLSQSRRAFVIGAGCSKYAGLPLMEGLTHKVLESLGKEENAYAVLDGLQKNFDGSSDCTIEDYMSELVDHIAIAERRRLRSATADTVSINDEDYGSDELTKALNDIKNSIAKVIRQKSAKTSTHRDFVRTIHKVLQSGKAGPQTQVDYYTLNYDTLFEDALSLERIPVADGFNGGATGWWDPQAYKDDTAQARVFKVHGSIDWCLLDDEVLPRRVRDGIDVDSNRKPILIWPASTKYREAQRDPFARIIDEMRRSLRPSSENQVVLTICGYSFGDDHVNFELDRALRESDGRLTIIAFTDEDEPKKSLKDWRDDCDVRGQVRIYANRGFFHGTTEERSEDDLPWWKFEILTRLLRGER